MRTATVLVAAICIAATSACSSSPGGHTTTGPNTPSASSKPVTHLAESMVVGRESFPTVAGVMNWYAPHINPDADDGRFSSKSAPPECAPLTELVPHGQNASAGAMLDGDTIGHRNFDYRVDLVIPASGEAPDWATLVDKCSTVTFGQQSRKLLKVQRTSMDQVPPWATTMHVELDNGDQVTHASMAFGNYRGVIVAVRASRDESDTTAEDDTAVVKLFNDEVTKLDSA